MTRFLNGLNRDIRDLVKLYDYTSIYMLVHQASKVESQLKRHGIKSYPTTSSNWNGKERSLFKRDKIPRKGNAPLKGHRREEGHITS
ncbi:hypothetical protein CR513_61168, partial [Mucuna pruriens]